MEKEKEKRLVGLAAAVFVVIGYYFVSLGYYERIETFPGAFFFCIFAFLFGLISVWRESALILFYKEEKA